MEREEVVLLEHPFIPGKLELPGKLKESGEFEKLKSVFHDHDTSNVKGNMRCQVLRSSAKWSMDTDTEVRLPFSSRGSCTGRLSYTRFFSNVTEFHPNCLHRLHQ